MQDFWTINSIWERFSPILTVAYFSDGLKRNHQLEIPFVNNFSDRLGPESVPWGYLRGPLPTISDMCSSVLFKSSGTNQSFRDPTADVVCLKIFTWLHSGNLTYYWWTKSCTIKDDDYPIIYRFLTIPGGAGFLPSTVAGWKMDPEWRCISY